MERIVKHRDLRHFIAKQFNAGVNALNVREIVQRRQVAKALNAVNDALVNQHAFVKQRAALHHAVSDCGNFGNVVNHLAVALGQQFFHHMKSRRVVFHRYGLVLHLHLYAVRVVCVRNTAFGGVLYAFANAFGDELFVFHVNQLIFQR